MTTADGFGLHVVEDGDPDAPAVLMCHGWPDTHVVWDLQVPALVDSGFRAIRFDQRGFGRSDFPDDPADCHVFKAMIDLGSILDALEVKDAHLVGHDWGSAPCWLAATFAPERVRTITSLSVGHPASFRAAGFEQKAKSFYMLLFQFVDVAEQWLQADDWANMKTLIGDLDNWPMRRAELEKPGALTSSLNWYRANMSPRSLVEEPDALPPVSRPALGVMGVDDWALLPAQMKGTERHVEGEFRYEEIAGAAHWIQTDQPEQLNALLCEWLSSHA